MLGLRTAYIAPVEGSAQGRIVLDGSLAGWGVLDAPITCDVEGGQLAAADGAAAARWRLEALDAGGPNGRVLAELGVGINPGAQITGAILEDEKVAGTIHFAFGTNTSMGGRNQAAVHIDGLVRGAVLEVDGRDVALR